MVCGNAYVKRFAKFPDLFETRCWQPWLIASSVPLDLKKHRWFNLLENFLVHLAPPSKKLTLSDKTTPQAGL